MHSGNIALTQGLETVVEAATRLSDSPDIAFVIVGEPSAIAKLKDYCTTCGATNVHLLPFQPREKLPEMLAAADVGLIVQKHNVVSFNMPSKTQVLLSSGRAIVASVPSTGSAAKAIEKSRGGMVVAPENPEALANAILKLSKDPELADRYGYQGRQYALERYSFEQALMQYEKLFYAVASTRKRPVYTLRPEESRS